MGLVFGLLIYAMVRSQMQTQGLSVSEEVGYRAKMLIVDDDPDFVNITKRVLDSYGYQIHGASSGAEALRVLRAPTIKPDLVLLDVMMDYVTDGLDVRKAMQKDPNLKAIPVIMITSLTGVRRQIVYPSDQHVAVSAWLSKPVQPQGLLKTAEETLARVPAGVPVGAPVVTQSTVREVHKRTEASHNQRMQRDGNGRGRDCANRVPLKA